MFTIEAMDESYADAWYGVEHETATLEHFEANAGLRGAEMAMHANYSVSERVSVSLYCANMSLLDDARDTPYTTASQQQTFLLHARYSF
jgi:outer membrane scaffolding protein for murein synthesis (MipA/OmpV family)